MNIKFAERYAKVLIDSGEKILPNSSTYEFSTYITEKLLEAYDKFEMAETEYSNPILGDRPYLLTESDITIAISDKHTLVIRGKVFQANHSSSVKAVRFSSSIYEGERLLVASSYSYDVESSLALLQEYIRCDPPVSY